MFMMMQLSSPSKIFMCSIDLVIPLRFIVLYGSVVAITDVIVRLM